MTKKSPFVDHQSVALEVPRNYLVDSDIHETSSDRFVLKN